MKQNIFVILLSLINFTVFSQNKFIENTNQFSFLLYQQIEQSDNNFVFSPFSISSAFAMTYLGSKNLTQNEISHTFGFTKDYKQLSSDYLNLIKDSKNTRIFNANSLWIDNSIVLEDNFKSFNSTYFSSSLKSVDFFNNPEETRLEINNWVEAKTNKKINDLLQPSTIDKSTRLVLVNAIYFKDSWKNKFNHKKNFESEFYIAKRKKVSTTFMTTYINTWYYETKHYKIIDIPFSDNHFSLLILLPKSIKKLRKIEKELDNALYQEYISKKQKKRVHVSIPKFKVESDYDLNQTLYKLGIKSAFNSSADFSGITKSERLFISNAIHKANIEIDEEGAEAAAATAITMSKTAALLEVVEFNANNSFIYMLRNTENNCIYFMGKINNPNEK